MTLSNLVDMQLMMISKNIENRLQSDTNLMLFFNYVDVKNNKYEFKLRALITHDIRKINISLTDEEIAVLQSYSPEIFISELQSIIISKLQFKIAPFMI